MTIGLCMIVKDELDEVIRIMNSYSQFFDKVFITVTHKDNLEKITKWCGNRAVVSYYEWDSNFSNARNFNFIQADTDYIFWIDADDDIQGAEKIKELPKTYPDVDLFYMTYLYSFDESGNCNMRHPRERLIKNNKSVSWLGKLHETLCPQGEVILTKIEITDISVVHRATMKDIEDSTRRNITMLLEEYKKDKENTDPRTISYLATSLGALGHHSEAIKLYEEHIHRSGWREDIYLSWCGVAQNFRSLYMDTGKKEYLENAISADNEGILLFPTFPDSYLGLGETYFHMRDWDKAIYWTELGMSHKIPETLPFHDPTRYTVRPLPILAYARLNNGDIEKAYAIMKLAQQKSPNTPFIKDNFQFFEDTYFEHHFHKSLLYIAKYLEGHDKLKTKNIPLIIPSDLAKDDRFIKLRVKYSEPKKWEENSIVIYCGMTAEEWGDPSTVKGIGGSEEAVIYLSRELTKLGYKVTVYSNCGELDGVYSGVEYKNYYEFNTHDVFNILISWRANIFTHPLVARQKIIWMHDVPYKNQFNKETEKTFDKIVVLSNYHRSLFPDVTDDKVFVSTNGLNLPDLRRVDKKELKKNHHRIIYSSSYDRGLEHLLDMWASIKAEVPQAELHVFYGWNSFDAMNEGDEGQKKWKAKMEEKLKQGGITEHGRVGHLKLLEEFSKSGIWAYPTFFSEINCITGLKAQAMGCIPVYHNHYALSDTVHYGYGINPEEDNRVTLNKFRTALINVLKNPEHSFIEEMKEDIREQYSWENVAKTWKASLLLPPRLSEQPNNSLQPLSV